MTTDAKSASPEEKPAAPDVKPATAPDIKVVLPQDLLKAAVSGKAEARKQSVAATLKGRLAAMNRADPRLMTVTAGALALGAMLGVGLSSLAASRDRGASAAIASLAAAMDQGRGESAKLAATLAKLEQSLAEMRAASETARRDASSKNGGVGEKIAQLDRSLTTKLAALSERVEQAEREQTNRIVSLAARATPAVKPEPTQTGSLAEPRDNKTSEGKSGEKTAEKATETRQAEARPPETAKADPAGKSQVLENYALRDIFEGAAIIENRNRRLFQVAPGDTLPGAGRVEALERRGRHWVVVTRQGIVTPQPW